MAIVPVYGHMALRERLLAAAARDALPASLLLVGPRGVGKQRLGLWLGQALLCADAGSRPCGRCQPCRYAVELAHPDLHWYFPRPRLKDADAGPDDVVADYADALQERARGGGLYAPSSGTDGLFVATVRAIVHRAAVSPALGRRKVFVVGDAERMVPQTGADQAANAFLKLLEEPPADTTIVLTSSEPGALLPTVRSRVVTVRVPPLTDDEVRAFAAHPLVTDALARGGAGASPGDAVRRAAGAPGALFGGAERSAAVADARRLLDAALTGTRADRLRTAFSRGVAGARGAYSDVLDALTEQLRDVARDAVAPATAGAPGARDPRRAVAASRAVDAVERAKERAAGNASPQLVTAALLRELTAAFR